MRRPLMFWSFCLVALIAFVYSRWPSWSWDGPPDNTPIVISGRVTDKDDYSFDVTINQISILNDAAVSQQDFPNKRQNKIMVSYEQAAKPDLGANVVLQGTFCVFWGATNPGEFDYADYYSSMGYLGRLYDVQIVGQESNRGIAEFLYELRCYWKARLYSVFPPKEASVMTAILLGDKSGVDREMRDLYQRNGIVHILSISGLHITIIGMGIYKLLRNLGLPVWIAALTGAVILVLYGIMTGLGVSVCRAIGMYLLRMLGLLWGRTYDMLTALAVVGCVAVMMHPAWLTHMGFLLSYVSVLGLGMLLPALAEIGEGRPRKPGFFVEGPIRRLVHKGACVVWGILREGMLAGISITLTTLPIQLWFSYEISKYSILLNALVLPLMSGVMVSGLIAMLIPGLGFVGTVDVVILSGYEGLCSLFEQIPQAMWNPGRPMVWQVVVYYVLWAMVVYGGDFAQKVLKRKDKVQRLPTGPGMVEAKAHWNIGHSVCKLLLLIAAVGILNIQPVSADRITFLDVGQGDCICIRLSGGEVYLFDCGSSSRSNVGENVLIPYLKYYGISEIDGVFASHGDADHVNGLGELFWGARQEHIRVKHLILPERDNVTLETEFGELIQTAKDADIPVAVMDAGKSWSSTSGDTFVCVHPGKAANKESAIGPAGGKSANRESATGIAGGNAGSHCFWIELGEEKRRISVLLTGDVEGIGESALIENLEKYGMENVSILKVAHHGSNNSTTEKLVELLNPRISVISCGRKNIYGHPHKETVERLTENGSVILTTPECGAVTIEIGKEIKVWGWRESGD